MTLAMLLPTGLLLGSGIDSAVASGCWQNAPGTARSPGTVDNSLNGVAVLSGCDAWAVGSRADDLDARQTLTEHWNGRHWSTVPSPSPGGATRDNDLNAVAAVSARDVWAVGDDETSTAATVPLAEHWNGVKWKQVAVPVPKAGEGFLYGVVALSTSNAWAVGETCPSCGSDETLAYHWNGHAWRQVTTPNPTDFDALRAVSAVSRHDVWAVGSAFDGTANQTLAMHWNGHHWKVVATPDPAGTSNLAILFGVSTDSTKDAWAVGKYYDGTTTVTLALHWDGASWKWVKTRNPTEIDDQLAAVTALSTQNAWAVGEAVNSVGASQTLVEHWNGTRWRVVDSPDPGGTEQFNTLYGVAALTAAKIWAVGSYSDGVNGKALAVALP
jgi:hypothetical protein